jgi:hypothetical protein
LFSLGVYDRPTVTKKVSQCLCALRAPSRRLEKMFLKRCSKFEFVVELLFMSKEINLED